MDTAAPTTAPSDHWSVVSFGLAAVAIFTSVVGIGLGLRALDEDSGRGVSTTTPEVVATLSEFAIDLSTNEVDAGPVIEVTNAGTAVHNLAVESLDMTTPDLAAGAEGKLDLRGLADGSYQLLCTIPGHAEAGMKVALTIGESGEASAGHGAHGGMTAHDGAVLDEKMLASVKAFPAETEGVGNQPLAPTVLADGTKRFELTASIVDWEVSPGKTVKAWAYNGTVPGPRIDLEVGDRVEVEIHNELPIGTDIHWHGIDVPNDQDGVSPITQDLVRSGESYTYRFRAAEAAIGMYHAHAHAHEAVPNGLFGTMYVGDLPLPAGRTVSGISIPTDLTIAQDLPMVLNDAGVIGLSLDGKSFPATTPIVATAGEWIRLTYFNEGLQIHPMHLHGFEQIVVAKDGEPLDQPYAADTIAVAPGERYTVLFHASDPGTWVFHCHILNHVESSDGMFGMVTAVVVR